MSDEPVYSDDYVKLRDEMAAEIQTLKESFEASVKEKDELIAKLEEQNKGLQKALMHSAMTEPTVTPAEKEPTEEELYQAEVDELAELTKEVMAKKN